MLEEKIFSKYSFTFVLTSIYFFSSHQSPVSDITISEFDQPSFTSYTDWQISNGITDAVYTCSSYGSLFGGYLKFGSDTVVQKKFLTPQPHYSATVNLNFMKIDSWDAQEIDGVTLHIMNTVVKTWIRSDFQGFNFICGGSSNSNYWDSMKPFTFSINHKASTLDLKFVSHFTSAADDESWGIRDLVITLKMCDSTCKTCSGPAENECLSCVCPKYLKNGYCLETCNVGDICIDCEVDDTIIREFTDSTFSTYADWTFPSNISSPITASCGSLGSLFGGPGIFGYHYEVSKSYSTPFPHYSAKITLKFVQLDSWDPTPYPGWQNQDDDEVSIFLMNNLVKQIKSTDFITRASNICGGNRGVFDYDETMSSSTQIVHTSNTLDLKFVSHLNQAPDDESWGIRDIVITLQMCNPTCASCFYSTGDACETCKDSKFLYSKSCIEQYCLETCPDGFWADVCSQTCKACHINCKTCIGPDFDNCLTCSDSKPFYFSDKKTCSSGSCPKGSFELNTHVCSICHEKCLTCSGPFEVDCILPFAKLKLQTVLPLESISFLKHSSYHSMIYWIANNVFGFSTDDGTKKNAAFLQNAVCFALSLDQNYLAVATSSGTVNIYDASFSSSNPIITKNVVDNDTNYLAFSSDSGKLIASLTNDLIIWDVGYDPVFKLSNEVRQAGVQARRITFYKRSSNIVFFLKSDKKLLVHLDLSVNCLKILFDLTSVYGEEIFDFAMDSDFKRLAVVYGTPDLSKIAVYDIKSLSKLWEKSEFNKIRINFTPNDEFLTLSSFSNSLCQIKFLDAKSGNTMYSPKFFDNTNTLTNLRNEQITIFQFALDGTGMVLGYIDGNLDYFLFQCSVECAGFCAFPYFSICCNPPCKRCSGEDPSSCTSCSSPFWLSKDHTCSSKCPKESYPLDTRNSICISQADYCGLCSSCTLSCSSTCKTCIERDTKCTSCLENTYLFDFSCVKTCKSDMYPDNADWTCKKCHSTCLSCSGGSLSDCTSCVQTKVLISGICSEICVSGQYWDSSDRACHSCSSPCATCSGNASMCKTCLDKYYFHSQNKSCNDGCSAGSFGNPDNFLCESSCKSGQYANSLRICIRCSEPCLECDLFGTGIECTKCNDDRVLYNKQCLIECPINFFKDRNNSCRACSSNCKLCNNSTECLECANDYFLSSNRTCVDCLNPNQIKLGLTCKECAQNCEFCASTGECLRCTEGFVLKSSGNCAPTIKNLNANISFGNPQNIVILDFGSDSESFVDMICKNTSNSLRINITNLTRNDFSFTCSKTSSSKILIYINFEVSVFPGHLLTIEIKTRELVTNDSKIILENFLFSLTYTSLIQSCAGESSVNCSSRAIITPELKMTANPKVISLSFNKPFPALLENLTNITNVSIEGVDSSKFLYEMNRKTNLVFDILIKRLHLSTIPTMSVTFVIPVEILSSPKFQLSTDKLQVVMENYIDPESPEMGEVERAAPAVSRSASLIKYTKSLSTVTKKNSQNFRGGNAAESIRYFRYLSIKYPGNCINFEDAPDTISIDWLGDYKWTKDDRDPKPTEKFRFYDVDIYLINNLGSDFVQICVIYLLAMLISRITIRRQILRQNMKRRFITYFLFKIFVWGMPIGLCISSYPSFSFYLFVSLRWISFSSTKGILNFCFSIIIALYLIFLERFFLVNLLFVKRELEKRAREKELNKENSTEAKLPAIKKWFKQKFNKKSQINKQKSSKEPEIIEVNGQPPASNTKNIFIRTFVEELNEKSDVNVTEERPQVLTIDPNFTNPELITKNEETSNSKEKVQETSNSKEKVQETQNGKENSDLPFKQNENNTEEKRDFQENGKESGLKNSNIPKIITSLLDTKDSQTYAKKQSEGESINQAQSLEFKDSSKKEAELENKQKDKGRKELKLEQLNQNSKEKDNFFLKKNENNLKPRRKSHQIDEELLYSNIDLPKLLTPKGNAGKELSTEVQSEKKSFNQPRVSKFKYASKKPGGQELENNKKGHNRKKETNEEQHLKENPKNVIPRRRSLQIMEESPDNKVILPKILTPRIDSDTAKELKSEVHSKNKSVKHRRSHQIVEDLPYNNLNLPKIFTPRNEAKKANDQVLEEKESINQPLISNFKESSQKSASLELETQQKGHKNEVFHKKIVQNSNKNDDNNFPLEQHTKNLNPRKSSNQIVAKSPKINVSLPKIFPPFQDGNGADSEAQNEKESANQPQNSNFNDFSENPDRLELGTKNKDSREEIFGQQQNQNCDGKANTSLNKIEKSFDPRRKSDQIIIELPNIGINLPNISTPQQEASKTEAPNQNETIDQPQTSDLKDAKGPPEVKEIENPQIGPVDYEKVKEAQSLTLKGPINERRSKFNEEDIQIFKINGHSKETLIQKDIDQERLHISYLIEEGVDQYLTRYDSLHSDINIESRVNINWLYPLFDMNRHIINNFAVVFLSDYTLLQLIIICSTNGIILFFNIF